MWRAKHFQRGLDLMRGFLPSHPASPVCTSHSFSHSSHHTYLSPSLTNTYLSLTPQTHTPLTHTFSHTDMHAHIPPDWPLSMGVRKTTMGIRFPLCLLNHHSSTHPQKAKHLHTPLILTHIPLPLSFTHLIISHTHFIHSYHTHIYAHLTFSLTHTHTPLLPGPLQEVLRGGRAGFPPCPCPVIPAHAPESKSVGLWVLWVARQSEEKQGAFPWASLRRGSEATFLTGTEGWAICKEGRLALCSLPLLCSCSLAGHFLHYSNPGQSQFSRMYGNRIHFEFCSFNILFFGFCSFNILFFQHISIILRNSFNLWSALSICLWCFKAKIALPQVDLLMTWWVKLFWCVFVKEKSMWQP